MNTDQRLTNLPQTAARQLGGLNADARLLASIRAKACEAEQPKPALRIRPALAACAAAALVLVVGTVALLRQPAAVLPTPEPGTPVLDSRSAGEGFGASDSNELVGGGIAITGNAGMPAAASLFAEEERGNFPLLRVDGKTYRLLNAPLSLDASLVGESLGPVGEFTLEPALSGGAGVISNAVTPGATVYAVSGLEGAMVCADLNGQTRVFQRVSFAGTATVGGETLRDTLAPSAQVVALELTGVGAITDAQAAQRLMDVLYQNASFTGASANMSADQRLTIHLQNGLSLELAVNEDALSACGTWSCPEFIEAFELAISEG